MRLMLTFTIPVERGNAAAQDGTLGKAIEDLIKTTNAEAAYFTLIDGQRGGAIVFDATDPAILPRIVEPMFAALDAAIEAVPVLSLDDLKRGLAG
jgi:hypothetical protein